MKLWFMNETNEQGMKDKWIRIIKLWFINEINEQGMKYI